MKMFIKNIGVDVGFEENGEVFVMEEELSEWYGNMWENVSKEYNKEELLKAFDIWINSEVENYVEEDIMDKVKSGEIRFREMVEKCDNDVIFCIYCEEDSSNFGLVLFLK